MGYNDNANEYYESLIEGGGVNDAGQLNIRSNFQRAIDEGRAYSVRGNEVGVAIGATYDMAIVTGSNPASIAGVSVYAIGEALEFSMWEDATVTGGTEPPQLNFNRTLSALIFESNVLYEPTVTDDGLLLSTTSLYGTQASNSIAAIIEVAVNVEFILKANTTYLFRLTNIDAVSAANVQMAISATDSIAQGS